MNQAKSDGGYGWLVVLAAFLANATGFGLLYSFTIFFPEILNEFDQGQGATSFIGSIAAAVMLGSGAVVGRFTDRFGPKLAVAAGAFLLSAGLLISASATAIWQVFIAFGAVLGFGLALAFVPPVSAVSQWFTKRRGLATGIAVAGSGIGTVVTAPVSQWLIEGYGWRTAARIIAVGGLVVLMISAALVRGKSMGHRGGVAKSMFSDRIFRRLYMGAVFGSYGYWIPFIFIVPYAREHALSPAFAAFLVSMMGAANTAGRIILGAVADRFGRVRIFQFAVVSMGAATLLWPLARQSGGLIAFSIAYGFVAGTFIALLFAITADYFGVERMAGTVGLLNTAAALGTLIGPPITGAMFDSLGSYTLPILIAGATWGLSALFFLRLPEPSRARESPAAIS
ncbi:MAG: MFS transporter [Actinobacteria bacterium]|nr:MFS transporter [Actinomycetota bacterium]